MLFKTSQLPSFAVKAAKLTTARSGESFSTLTIGEAEACIMGWMWSAAAELQQIPEKAPLYFNRLEAIEVLRLCPLSFDRLVKAGVIEKHYLGGKLVFTQDALLNAIKTEKTTYYTK